MLTKSRIERIFREIDADLVKALGERNFETYIKERTNKFYKAYKNSKSCGVFTRSFLKNETTT